MWNANQVANWFLVKHSSVMQLDEAVDENLTQMKLHKLMYYAQGVKLAVFSERLFDEELLAWTHGPVVRSIFSRFQGSRELENNLVTEEELNDYRTITANIEDNMVLEAVYDKFGGFSAGELRNMTHNETPWLESWEKGNGKSSISDESIKQYFRDNIVEV